MAYNKLYLLIFAASIGAVKVSANTQLRNGKQGQSEFWRNNIIVYANGTSLEDAATVLIEKSMRELERAVKVGHKCLTFKKKTSISRYYLLFVSSLNGSCYSESKSDTRRLIYLAETCLNKRDILAMLLIELGLHHEHQRLDRDHYIQVHMDNVQDTARPYFQVIQPGDTDLLGLPYDFHSVTHYGPYQYAINTSLPTITTNVSGFSFDKRDTLSFYDVLKVQTLYGCPKGYTMFDKDINRFNQTPADRYYPQWSFTSDKLRDYMNTTCDREGNYTLTALNGAKWISKFPLPSGNFCVSVCICIASSSSKIKSYIQLTTMEGLDISKLNYTQPSGHWDRLNTTYTSEQEWTMLVKAHIMWGRDVLALSNMVITNGVCGM